MTNEEILNKTEKKNRNMFFTPWLIVPLIIMVLLVVAALMYSEGRSVELSKYSVSILSNDGYEEQYCGLKEDSSVVLLYDSGLEEASANIKNTVCTVMDTIRVDYKIVDMSQKLEIPKEDDLVLYCSPNLDRFSNKEFDEFVDWLKTGNIIFFCTPDFYSSFGALKDYLGIVDVPGQEVEIDDVYFVDNILPGLKGETLYDSGLKDSINMCILKEESSVSIMDVSSNAPIIWDYSNGRSNITVYNNYLLEEKNVANGLAVNSIVKHLGQHAWPILNSFMVYIDDFPAPQPEGFDERLKKQFGYDTQGFFMNIWWPDMKKLAEKHDIKYNGVFVETYNKVMEPPFPRGTASTILRYYGAELLSSGGEIALHGYNHQSLIPEGYPNQDDYKGWPSQENMKLASITLLDYAKTIFPEVTYTSYVPPSNYLSDEGYNALKEAIPDLKVISALYYQNTSDTAYCTDFFENEDGIINVPRITSGYDMGPFDELLMYSSLYEDGVVSHFIHPDDVLDVERGAEAGWNNMRDALDKSFERVKKKYSMLRGLTGTPTGGLVQRRQRCNIITENVIEDNKEKINITLENFVDEQWISLYSEKEIASVENGTFYDLGEGSYWIDCKNENVVVNLK